MIDEREFNHYVKLYTPHLLRFAKRVAGSVLEPRDILQECFETCWRNRDKVNPASVKSFLFTVAHRRIVDSYRSLKISVDPVDLEKELSVPKTDDPSDSREVVWLGLNRLSPVFRELIVLRDLEGYSYEEIGKICDLSESQVKVYLFRARKGLRDTVISLVKEVI